MSTAADTKPASWRPKQREKRPRAAPAANSGTDRLKTVVRRLPPNLPEEVFWQSVQAWVTDETVSWKVYCPGKMRKRANKENIPSRAYIAFKNEEVLATFSREYDGHTFRDKAGNESQAIVEFAPFQKVPTEKKKVDARNNTIENDEDYISFIESLKGSEKTEPVSLEALIAAAQQPPPPTTTPLLEAIKAEKSAQKDKEAILRNHAHYKESLVAKKEEAKKKAAAAAQAQAAAITTPSSVAQKQHSEPGPAPQTVSRKAKKAAAAAAAAQKAASQDTQPPVRIAKPPAPAASSGGAAPAPSPPRAAHSPPTAPRAHRERQHRGYKAPAASAHAKSNETAATASQTPAPAPSTDEAGATAAAAAASSPPAPAAPQARRGRPVIGIGRHFEAALSGAVGGAERRKRAEKERDKDKDKDKDGGNPSAQGGSGASGGAPPEAKSAGAGTGSGKRKDHHPAGGKHKEDKNTAGSSGTSAGQPAAVPSILQRSDGPTAPAALGDVSTAQRPQSPHAGHGGGHQTDTPSGRGGGGGKRGRGRGRGGHRGG